jgi:hypothetical protein
LIRDRHGVGHDRLGSLEVVPVDKAISWPFSQERVATLVVGSWRAAPGTILILYRAPLGGAGHARAPISPASIWLKNEQRAAAYAGQGTARAMNGLSTGCSTVFVRKPCAGA